MVKIRLEVKDERFGSDVKVTLTLEDFNPPLTVEEARRKCEEIMREHPDKIVKCEVIP